MANEDFKLCKGTCGQHYPDSQLINGYCPECTDWIIGMEAIQDKADEDFEMSRADCFNEAETVDAG